MPRLKIGRPLKMPAEGENAMLGIVGTPELKRKLIAAAERNRRSLSAEMRFRIEKTFRDDEIMQRLDEIEERWGEEGRRTWLRARLNRVA